MSSPLDPRDATANSSAAPPPAAPSPAAPPPAGPPADAPPAGGPQTGGPAQDAPWEQNAARLRHDQTAARRGRSLARPLLALIAAAFCAAITALLAQASVNTAKGQRLDQLIFSGAQADDGALTRYAEVAVGTVSVPVMAVLLGIALVLVLVRREFSLLLPLALLVAGANLTTQVLKHLVVVRDVLGPGIDITPNSFPSGHTTLAAASMVAVVLASGRAKVLLAPIGALWAAAAGIGTLVVGWHRPSDAIGAIVIVAAWTFLVLALDALGSRRRFARAQALAGTGRGRRRLGAPAADGPAVLTPPRTGAATTAVAVLLGVVGLGALALGAAGIVGLQLPLDLQDPAQQSTSFLATAALIAGGTASWMALVLILRTPTSHRSRAAERVP
ncbi:phosphatase PAP2 family protein [Brachybacterium alimentarium]|uniref:phosphatase PAP2 family protein n=1 Tax=Brachybacterium alimentarium TaxID=47845 RepID=UPI003FCF8B30